MFKKYLRVQPASIQLVIFLSFWSVLYLLGQFASITYVRVSMHLTSDKVMDFISKDIYKYPMEVFVCGAISSVFCFLLPALIFAYLADPKPMAYLGVKKQQKNIQLLVVVIMAFLLICFVSPLATWMQKLNLGDASKALDEEREQFLQSYLSSSSAITTLRSILLIAVIPAICEECFFRGIFMKLLHSFVPNWWFSIGVSAIIFAAFHFSISEFLPICLAGIILGIVYYLTSSLWLSILLHLLFNGLQALLSIYSNPTLESYLSKNTVSLGLFAISSLLIAGCLSLLFKNKTPLPERWSIMVPEIIEEKWDMNA